MCQSHEDNLKVMDMNPSGKNQNFLEKRMPLLLIEKEKYPTATRILLDELKDKLPARYVNLSLQMGVL